MALFAVISCSKIRIEKISIKTKIAEVLKFGDELREFHSPRVPQAELCPSLRAKRGRDSEIAK